MNRQDLAEDKIPVIVKNEWFYLVARFCIIVATIVGLPTATWMMSRVIAKADEISNTQIAQNLQLQLLSQEIKFRFQNQDDRIRGLEKR